MENAEREDIEAVLAWIMDNSSDERLMNLINSETYKYTTKFKEWNKKNLIKELTN